ncbi:MAG: hypothetical protein ACRD0D_01545, partial [Acidimicrobiales bacterium]
AGQVVASTRARAAAEVAAAEASLVAAPARLRPVLGANRAARLVLGRAELELRSLGSTAAAERVAAAAAALPGDLAGLAAAGVDVGHFIHVRFDDDRPGPAAAGPGLPRIRKARSERLRAGSPEYDRSLTAQVRGEIDELKAASARTTAAKIAASPVAQEFASVAEAGRAAYTAWDPASPFEKAAQATSTTVYIPDHVFRAFRAYFRDPNWDRVLNLTYDRGTRVFKATVLALSPSWQVGNLGGNILMATLGAGVSPVALAASTAKVVAEWRRSGPPGERALPGPARLFGASPRTEYLARTAPGAKAPNRAVSALGAPVRASYRLNAFIDDVGRSAVFMARKAKGETDEAALRLALRAMGDFARMTPFERRVVRRILPFYAWMRHSTQLSLRLPVEHPLRVAWVLHTGDVLGEDETLGGLPEHLRGGIPLGGGRVLATANIFPFRPVVGDLEGLSSSLAPQLKLGLVNLPGSPARGVNPLTGRPYSRPQGTGRLDELGRPLPTAPGLLKQVTDISPQKRLFEGLSGRSDVVRFESGDPVLTRVGRGRAARYETIPADRSAAAYVGRAFGLNVLSRATLEKMLERARERREDEARAAQRTRERQREARR